MPTLAGAIYIESCEDKLSCLRPVTQASMEETVNTVADLSRYYASKVREQAFYPH